jgi:beta-glucosidase
MQVKRDRLPDWQKLSLRQQIGQLIVARASGHLFDHQRRYPRWEASNAQLEYWLRDLNLGGVILLGGSAVEINWRSRQLQAQAQTPLLIAADIEEGVGQRFAGATWFPPPMALSAIADAQQAETLAAQMGAITAQEALALGINWLLAPVVDVNNNPDNPVINVRAFGDTPATVSRLTQAFIEGARPYPVLTAAKHFPGHGDTATDSHLTLPVVPHSVERLQTIELPPFQSAIAAGVSSIMTAHLSIPAWDAQNPATLSRAILTEQLRDRLGFKGLIVTDALIMGGVAQCDEAAEICVRAIAAGADILLMPPDPAEAVEAIYRAVEQGRLSRDRLTASVERIWQAKQQIQPDAPALPETVLAQLSSPHARATARAIASASLQTGGSAPLTPPRDRQLLNLIVVDNLLACDFLDNSAAAVAVPHQLGYKLQLLQQQSLSSIDPTQVGLLQVFSRGNPFRGSAKLAPEAEKWFKNLLRSGKLGGLAIYGSPYILKWFRPHLPLALPWVFSYGQMPMAQALASQYLFSERRDPHLENEVEAFT